MENLNKNTWEVRKYAIEEFLLDCKSENLYISKKLLPDSRLCYFRGLREALLNGSVTTFTEYLNKNNCLTADALKVENATWSLAYNEFKRYYIRGVCKQAIAQDKLLRVCRLRTSKNQSEDAASIVGQILHPELILKIATKIPGTSSNFSNKIAERILRPNSGLGVEIYDANSETTILNDKGENYEQ